MEKGVKQGRSSYPLLSMKKDQANKMNVERVYRWQPLAWEPGPNRSGIDPRCRWDISLVSNVPIGTGFGPQNTTVITSQESHHWHAFLIRIAKTIFHMRSKLRGNYAIKFV